MRMFFFFLIYLSDPNDVCMLVVIVVIFKLDGGGYSYGYVICNCNSTH